MSPHPLTRITPAALGCAARVVDELEDAEPLRVLEVCSIDPDGAAELVRHVERQVGPHLAEQHPDIDRAVGLELTASGVLAGLCIGALAIHHATGHGADDRTPTMTDADVDVALSQITNAVARHQGAGADTPEGLAESLRGLDDVRSVFREATGIGAPR